MISSKEIAVGVVIPNGTSVKSQPSVDANLGRLTPERPAQASLEKTIFCPPKLTLASLSTILTFRPPPTTIPV
jgi:hypothetical protein